jgi:hypothetical protein
MLNGKRLLRRRSSRVFRVALEVLMPRKYLSGWISVNSTAAEREHLVTMPLRNTTGGNRHAGNDIGAT